MNLIERIESVQRSLRQLEASSNRQPGSVKLLAVSKTRNNQEIRQAFDAGLSHFGENYIQEALEKIKVLTDLPISWHFIGAIQSNKSQAIAQNFSWAHGVCRKKIAKLLNDQRPTSLPPLNVCIQVNIDDEETKAGIQPELIPELASDIILLPHLRLRGLMVIPKPMQNEQQQYQTFLRVANLLHELNTQMNLNMDTLSMGMSDDLPAAIRAGSTMVRVGRSIFGERSHVA